jgi:nicotinate-nucleotide adenylyltransferase
MPARKQARIAIYGGTFDPIHHGHLILAQDALEYLKLDLLIFMPCAQSPHKPDRMAAPANDRIRMLELATAYNPRFWVSRLEAERRGPSYAIDTARTLADSFPNTRWWWIIGADQLSKLSTWSEYAELKQRVTFAVLPRARARLKKISGAIHLPKPRLIDISATEIRHRVKHHLPIHHLTPAPVADHIVQRRLYRK